jgi:hypothetical protein
MNCSIFHRELWSYDGQAAGLELLISRVAFVVNPYLL